MHATVPTPDAAPEAEAASPAAPHEHHRGRAVASWVLLVLACVTLAASAVAVWVNRVALDTDTWVDTSSEVLADPTVQASLATAIATRLDEQVGFEEEAAGALPPRLQGFAPVIATGAYDLVERGAERALAGPRVQELWKDANRVAHSVLLDVLEGRRVQTAPDGSIVLDLRPIIQEVAAAVGIDASVVQRIPDDRAQITVAPGQRLERARQIAHWLDMLALWLPILAIVLLAAAIWVAPDRRRQLGRVGIGLVLIAFLLVAARRGIGGWLPEQVAANTQGEATAKVVWRIVSEGLAVAAVTIAVIGVVAFVGAWLAAPRKWPTRMRGAVAPWLESPWRSFGTLAVLVAILIAWGPTPAARNPISIVILGGAAVLGLALLRRQALREHAAAAAIEPATA